MPSENTKRAAETSSAELQARADFDRRANALLAGRNTDPFGILGPHQVANGWAIRFFLPWAAEASIVFKNPQHSPAKIADAVKVRPEGLFEAVWPSDQRTAP